MNIEQIYTGCLAQGAYYIEDGGECAIIDPLREVSPYLERAQKDDVRIKYVFETHFHADFVSGHVTLAEKTGATIVYGPLANPTFEAHIAKDGEEFSIGSLTIRVLHTPGHTMESSCYLLLDAEGNEKAIFTGDTLFLGDVGRPDLAQKAASMTQEDLAGMLFDSLREKIMPLPDTLTVYPAHGAGSACGKNMMKETVDTLGNQKKMNYALRADMTREEFIAEVTDGLLPPPGYFPLNVKMNKEGYASIDQVLSDGMTPLSPETFLIKAEESEALVLDVRDRFAFADSHIPGSIFIGLDGSFAPWVGELIVDVKQPLLLVVADGKEEEAITRLSRVGFDNVLGYLNGGIEAWKSAGKEIDSVESITAEEMQSRMSDGNIPVVDVRKVSEYEAEHVEEATNVTLSNLANEMARIPQEGAFFIHCAGGYRSVIAASILKSKGYHQGVNIEGGFKAMKETGLPVTAFNCSTTS